jgi:glyoxylase-like metal-dependent hydrolase (beta-lactamase superfamily II)
MPLLPVLPGVSLIDLPWTNVWLLHEGKSAIVIDTGTCRDRKAVLSCLETALPRGFQLTSILLTHGHCDHAGNAAFLCEREEARLCAGNDEVPFISTPRTYIPQGARALSPRGFVFAAAEIVFPVKRRQVDTCLIDGDIVDTPIGPLTVVDTPGHTIGHVSYFHKDRRILFSGDALLTVIPFLRRGGLSMAPPIFSMDKEAAKVSVRKLAMLGAASLCAGHGWPWLGDTRDAINRFADSLPS